jgi:hypothetical protein
MPQQSVQKALITWSHFLIQSKVHLIYSARVFKAHFDGAAELT